MSEEFDDLQAELKAEAGGKIVNKAMVRILSGTTSSEVSADMYGLLILSPERLLFKHYSQNNWFSGMFSAQKSRDKEITLLIDLSRIVFFTRYKETSPVKRFLFRPEPYYSIEYRDTRNITRVVNIAISFCKEGESSLYSQLSGLLDIESE